VDIDCGGSCGLNGVSVLCATTSQCVRVTPDRHEVSTHPALSMPSPQGGAAAIGDASGKYPHACIPMRHIGEMRFGGDLDMDQRSKTKLGRIAVGGSHIGGSPSHQSRR